MIRLSDKDTGAPIGPIGDDELAYLQEQLEEETPSDQDYWINAELVDALEADGKQPRLVAVLRKALGEREEMEIRWSRD